MLVEFSVCQFCWHCCFCSCCCCGRWFCVVVIVVVVVLVAVAVAVITVVVVFNYVIIIAVVTSIVAVAAVVSDDTYLFIAECEVRTASYESSFSLKQRKKKRGSITCRTDLAN